MTTTVPLIRAVAAMLVAGWCVGLAACASQPAAADDPVAAVTARAAARWQALVKGEFDVAYTFATQGYRAVVSKDAYRTKFGAALSWTGTEVVRVQCPEPSKCTATVRIEFIPMTGLRKGGTMSTHVDETWLLENGQWWYFQNI